MNPLVIAVDTGNKNIKTPHTEPFNSGLICHGAIPPAVKSDTLLFDGNYYTLTQSRIPYMYNKTTDWSYYVLTLIAIAKEMMAMGYVRPVQKQVKQDVCLAMGLPPTHIHDLASEYDKYFGRDGRRVVFTYNNVDFEVRIVRVMVFPQGVAAIAPYMSKIMARPEAYTYIIDIGGYTTDVVNLWNNSSDTCTATVLTAPMLISPFPSTLLKCSSMTCCKNFCVLLSVSSISSLTFSCKSIGIFPQIFFISAITFLLSLLLHTTYSKAAWKAIHNTHQR